MRNPEIANKTEGCTLLDSAPSQRGRIRIVAAFKKAITRLHHDQRGEEGPGCGIIIAVGALVVSALIVTARISDQEIRIDDRDSRISALETAIAQIQTPTPTPTITPIGTPVR